jgi:hypothetical protein
LEKFSLKVAAEQSHACNENFRSLRYLEMHCLKHKESIEECASLLLVNFVLKKLALSYKTSALFAANPLAAAKF